MMQTLNWDGNIPLAQVLTHAIPAYAGPHWGDVFEYLHSTPSEAKVIAELAASLTQSGARTFTHPVRLHIVDTDPDDPDDDDPDDVDPLGRHWRVGNGMHRIATAVMLGHDYLPCTTTYPEDDPDTFYVEVTYELPDRPGEIDSLYPSLDGIDYSCGWLRSFPLPDRTWVECDSFSGSGTHLSGLWYCPRSHMDAFLAELQVRAPGIVIHSAVGKTAAELDAEYDLAGV